MDEEPNENKAEEEPNKRKEWMTTGHRRVLILTSLWWVVYFMAVIIYPPLLHTCNGVVATGSLFTVTYAPVSLFAGIRKDREALATYSVIVFAMAIWMIESFLHQCMSECP